MVDVCGTGSCNVYRTFVRAEYSARTRRCQIIFAKRSRITMVNIWRILVYNHVGIARRLDVMAVMEYTI